jgi:hypothetical protein
MKSRYPAITSIIEASRAASDEHSLPGAKREHIHWEDKAHSGRK